MKSWGWICAAAVFSLGAFGAFWLEQNPDLVVSTLEGVALKPVLQAEVPAAPTIKKPLLQPSSGSSPEQTLALKSELAAEFRRVADIYEQSSRFPPYSFPISQDGLSQYQYNRYIPVSVPLQKPGGAGDAEIRVVLEKLHFEKGEPITGLAAVYGPDASAISLSRVELINRGNETLMSAALTATGEGEYPIRLTPSESRAEDWQADLLIRVTGNWNRQAVAAVAPVFLDDPIGEIDSVGRAHIEGAHLQIPVEVDVDDPGFYVISANLYSVDGEPLVHVEHQAELSRFDSSTELKVHRVALEATGNPGPYKLRDLTLRQLPSKPGDRTRFGPTSDKTVKIPRFSFEQYSGAAYEDPLRQARLDFLRNAAGQP